jgi:hypothetical protein
VSPLRDNAEMVMLRSEDLESSFSSVRYELMLGGQAYDFVVPGEVTDPAHSVEGVATVRGVVFYECNQCWGRSNRMLSLARSGLPLSAAAPLPGPMLLASILADHACEEAAHGALLPLGDFHNGRDRRPWGRLNSPACKSGQGSLVDETQRGSGRFGFGAGGGRIMPAASRAPRTSSRITLPTLAVSMSRASSYTGCGCDHLRCS